MAHDSKLVYLDDVKPISELLKELSLSGIKGQKIATQMIEYSIINGDPKKFWEFYRYISEYISPQIGEEIMSFYEHVIAEGKKQGLEEGIKEGIIKGREEGWEQGKEAERERLIQKMVAKGYSIPFIAEFFELPVAELSQYLK